MTEFVFTQYAKKRFLKLSDAVQKRIVQKLQELKSHDDIFPLLKRLYHLEPATHRLRVGPYRLILELRNQKGNDSVFWVLDVGDRKNVYQ